MNVSIPPTVHALEPRPRLDAPDVRAGAYKAKVDAVSPEARRLTFEEEPACFFGISLENGNFARGKLMGMLEWIARRFPRCTVLVGDSIHRLTLQSVRGLPPDAAHAEALRLGREFLERERDAFAAFSDLTHFSFVTCADIQATQEYAVFHASLRATFDRDGAFRASVERFGRAYHGKHADGLGAGELERRVRASCDYFLEEFAVFACLYRRGLSVMVYPGSFSTLAEIAGGEHPDAPAELRGLTVVSLKLRSRGAR